MHGASVFDMRMSTTAAFTPLVTSYTGNNPKGKQTRKQKTLLLIFVEMENTVSHPRDNWGVSRPPYTHPRNPFSRATWMASDPPLLPLTLLAGFPPMAQTLSFSSPLLRGPWDSSCSSGRPLCQGFLGPPPRYLVARDRKLFDWFYNEWTIVGKFSLVSP